MKKLLLILINTTVSFVLLAFILPENIVASDYEWRNKKGDSEYENLYKYRQANDILPLEEILKIVRPSIQGKIIETEFEIEHGIPVYEFKYIDGSGRVMEMYVDARNGNILKIEEDD